jgi:hypothetical protein
MWIKLAKNKDEIGDTKLIKKLAETAIRSLLFKQGHYNPSEHDVNWRVQRVLEEIREEYGNLEDVRTKGTICLKPYVEKIAYKIFKNRKKD